MQSEVDNSLGYDILSYEEDVTPCYIEVKTTEQKNNNGELSFFYFAKWTGKSKDFEKLVKFYYTFNFLNPLMIILAYIYN